MDIKCLRRGDGKLTNPRCSRSYCHVGNVIISSCHKYLWSVMHFLRKYCIMVLRGIILMAWTLSKILHTQSLNITFVSISILSKWESPKNGLSTFLSILGRIELFCVYLLKHLLAVRPKHCPGIFFYLLILPSMRWVSLQWIYCRLKLRTVRIIHCNYSLLAARRIVRWRRWKIYLDTTVVPVE